MDEKKTGLTAEEVMQRRLEYERGRELDLSPQKPDPKSRLLDDLMKRSEFCVVIQD